jgi:hypothetical protein
MKKILLYLIICGVGGYLHAQVKPLMDQMMAELFKLKPFIASEDKYRDPKNHDTVDTSLKTMVDLSQKINHETIIQNSGLLVSSNVLNQQLKEAEAAYNNGNKDYSLWMLKSTLSVCMNCHTQVPATSTRFTDMNKDHILANPFEEGEFLFVIRNFPDAMNAYEKAIKGYPKNKISPADVEKIVFRQLFLYVRVERNIQGLISVLKEDGKNSELPPALQKKIQDLRSAAEKIKNEKYPTFNANEDAALRKYAETSLKDEIAGKFSFDIPEKELNYLKVSSVLYEYLSKNPGTHLKPDILYWLSFCESHYSHNAFYSLPELYLKQCVLEFPKNPVAKKCLTQYQNLVTIAFTGTQGAHIPEAIASELKTMQELVKKIGD